MTGWSRREMLRALGVSAAAPALAPLLQACGGAARFRPGVGGPAPTGLADVRELLRAVVSDLSRRHDEASALATLCHRGGAAVDANERGANRERQSCLLLSVTNGDVRFEQATTDLRPAGIARAAKRLERRAPRIKGRGEALAPPRNFAVEPAIDPAKRSPKQWLQRVEDLFSRARRVGGSRVVYRGAYLTVDDTETLFIGDGRDLLQRLVRTRAGVLLVAWTGAAPTADDASRSGTIGLEALDLDAAELEAAAERALSLLTARPAPSGEFEVVLDPTVTGLIANQALGAALEADRWHCGEARARGIAGMAGDLAVGSEHVTLVDDPTVAGGYGSYFFDDEGEVAKPTLLIDRGVVRGPITDRATAAALKVPRTANGRRESPLRRVAPRLSNVAFEPGDATRAALIERVERGLLVEGGLTARADPRTWQCAVRASRAKEIRDGKLTGALYGNLDLRSDVPSLLRGVKAMSTELVRHATDAVSDGTSMPMSSGGPFVLTRCEVFGG